MSPDPTFDDLVKKLKQDALPPDGARTQVGSLEILCSPYHTLEIKGHVLDWDYTFTPQMDAYFIELRRNGHIVIVGAHPSVYEEWTGHWDLEGVLPGIAFLGIDGYHIFAEEMDMSGKGEGAPDVPFAFPPGDPTAGESEPRKPWEQDDEEEAEGQETPKPWEQDEEEIPFGGEAPTPEYARDAFIKSLTLASKAYLHVKAFLPEALDYFAHDPAQPDLKEVFGDE